jgi:hypothetical protein
MVVFWDTKPTSVFAADSLKYRLLSLSDVLPALTKSADTLKYGLFSGVIPALTKSVIGFVNDLSHRFRFKKFINQKPKISRDEPLDFALTSPVTEPLQNLSRTSPVTEDEIVGSRCNVSESFCAAITEDYCEYCGLEDHSRSICPARNAYCEFCSKRGHISTVCKRRARLQSPQLSTVSRNQSLSPTIIEIHIDGQPIKALIDTGSSISFVDYRIAQQLKLSIRPCERTITLAADVSTTKTLGSILVSKLEIQDFVYQNFEFSILQGLCCDAIIGHDVFAKHKNLIVNFGGNNSDMHINPIIDDFLDEYCYSADSTYCNLAQANIDPPPLFHNISSDCSPIACRSRRYSDVDKKFIREQVDLLKGAGVVETSHSPWRAQVLVARDERHKPRLVIDYSRTINKFTFLDAYPLPRIDDMAFEVSKYKYYSTLDLKSAYHQIPIAQCDREYTAFEAGGELLQFTRIPFGVTNGVSAFQRTMDNLIAKHDLKGTFAYMDNLTVCGKTQEEHDTNLQRFYDIVNTYSLTLNHNKSILSVTEINMLGYLISYQTVKPDPERMQPLIDLPVPSTPKSLKRALGLFSYYSQWVEKFSDKIRPLTSIAEFPLSKEAVKAFTNIKHDIAAASLSCPNDSDMIIIESDASDVALSASLNQNGRPVAFFSRTLQQHEQRHPAIEKEAAAIIEACRKWKHYLSGRRFQLITDQQSVSFIYNTLKHGKTKNDKILRWRIELSCLDFDIKYRPGPENLTADCLSRAHCSAIPNSLRKLKTIHDDLCHPGISRLGHFVRSRNLPYSMEDVKSVISQCRVCAELKPNFFRPINPPLIKATQPFERLGIDFKGPVPSSTQNKYMLTVVDEYSRFPFVFPCRDMTAGVVIKCLNEIFATFGITTYIHSDNGSSLVSDELRSHLLSMGIGYSNSTRYNPKGNGQVERYNGTVWKAMQLALKSKGLGTQHWEQVIGSALHSIRTLVCTSTNQTPHERLFGYQRRTLTGHALPSWLLNKGHVLMKKHARSSKYDPLVEEVDLIEVNPSYAQVKTASGRELTVSLRDLAPLPPQEQTSYKSGTPLQSQVDHGTPTPAVNPIANPSASNVPLPGNAQAPVSTENIPSTSEHAPPAAVQQPSSFVERYPVRNRKQTDFYQA